MVRAYEWITNDDMSHILETDDKDQLIKYKGMYIEEILSDSIILKTENGIEAEIEANDLKIYEVSE
ncbi:hypothetical protein [Tetragenococcus halophilus]|uniref:Uncharacterized protein n=1 Tax=Tetragenococcus halophilus (strain DSM 20338 / JCM 20259 / NCIMB 9735 / NBRC 12172) TaxID=945021 RepID=A0AAN1VRK0_TETHN|nr:hypothetical protein [Tetragenococcus halophilus]BAK95163.1 hypothetical protein TEH_18360 [Tetragenococcus halophilus NBRC 12172]GBD71091.1 putative uncharacterized protein [Tetragenococcus halophilus subsp. halophilus]